MSLRGHVSTSISQNIPAAPYKDGTLKCRLPLRLLSFTGQAIGRLMRGYLEVNKDYSLCKSDVTKKIRIKELHVFEGLEKLK